MRTIALATDFSEAAFNAAQYAASLTRQIPVIRLVLYHSYYNLIATDVPLIDNEYYLKLQEDSISRLERIKNKLIPLVAPGVVIECLANVSSLQEAVRMDFLKENVELVIMGITGKSKLKEQIMGSQAIMAARNTAIPLLLIPFEATYKTIRKVIFAWDMENSPKTFPESLYKKIVQVLKAELFVLNIDYNNRNFDVDTIREQEFMHRTLGEENVNFFYGNHADATRGIIEFAERQQADLVMIIPRKNTFPVNLFKKKTTKKIAFHIKIPLLILPAVKNHIPN